MKNICLYGSASSVLAEVYYQSAHNLGKLLAQSGYGIVFGGGATGLMGAAAQGARDASGHIIGVIPEALNLKGVVSTICDELIVTKTLRERKAVMEKCSVGFVAMPGGYGTLEEMFEIITLKQLGYHNLPIVILNTNGFYDTLLDMFANIETQCFAHPETRGLFFMSDSESGVVEYIKEYQPENINQRRLMNMVEAFEEPQK